MNRVKIKAFTLLELISSIALFAVLISFLLKVCLQTFDLWEKNYASAHINICMDRVWTLFQIDFDNMQSLRSTDEISIFYQTGHFDSFQGGDVLLLEFYGKDYFLRSIGSLSLISYYLSKRDYLGGISDSYSLFRCVVPPEQVLEMGEGIEDLYELSFEEMLSFSRSSYENSYLMGGIRALELLSSSSEELLFEEISSGFYIHRSRNPGFWNLGISLEMEGRLGKENVFMSAYSFRKELNSL